MATVRAGRRREIERGASAIRAEGVRAGLHPHEVASRILDRFEEVTPLEAQRLARGWSRRKLSEEIDQLYKQDGLAPPGIAETSLCRWEHGDRVPSSERIDYLCRVYGTRPDRLGFGADHSHEGDGITAPGMTAIWPYTCRDSDRDLKQRIASAEKEIIVFGLTRNAYAREEFLDLFRSAASRNVQIDMFVMDPWCESRRDRYRVEPAEAAMEDPERYVRECLKPLHDAALDYKSWHIWTYNFPVAFAVEQIDGALRIMAYAPGRRGTESPIFAFSADFAAYDYFAGQLTWLRARATNPDAEPWRSKGVQVRPLILPL